VDRLTPLQEWVQVPVTVPVLAVDKVAAERASNGTAASPTAKPAASKKFRSNAAGKAGKMAAMWERQIDEVQVAATSDPFSKHFDAAKSKGLKKGDAGYGHAAEGSATAARAAKAQQWVDMEIDKMIVVIEKHAEPDGSGRPTITFGKLFDIYADISDTLVGILMRARKRKKLEFQGDMLFQGAHDAVVITVLVPS